MKRLWIVVIVSLVMPTLTVDITRGAGEAPPPQESTIPPALAGHPSGAEDRNQKATYRLDFSDYGWGSLGTWVETKGFKIEEAAKDPNALKLSVQDGALIFEAKERLRGFLFKGSMDIKNFS